MEAYQKIWQKISKVNGTEYEFWVEHSSIKKEDVLNIHQYLTIKNDIK